MKIIFMGTPEFAVPTLELLHNSSHQIIGVYTQPPSYSGRGKKLQKSIIHLKAEEYNLKVFTPKTFREMGNITQLKNLKPDIIVVAAYGLILTQEILDIPKFGCINIHPSLLPRWRGAAPMERTIEAGDKTTAVCIMKMDRGLDTGDILKQTLIQLEGNETASSLSNLLSHIGAKLTLETINTIDGISSTPQDQVNVTYAKKITKEEGLINWELPAKQIERKIRAFEKWPNCWFQYKGENIKILSANILPDNTKFAPGTVTSHNLTIQTGDGLLSPLKLQRPGKKIMDIKSFLNGMSIPPGTILK